MASMETTLGIHFRAQRGSMAGSFFTIGFPLELPYYTF